MGYDALVIADSTSRWAEALREIASRTGELPAEEGYPASLASSLAAFYERAGRVRTLGGDVGSVTILGAVSPPGGDMAEPVTAHTERFVRSVWSLDRDLAYARHYPAVSWRRRPRATPTHVARWHARAGRPGLGRAPRAAPSRLLAEADRVQAVAELVGAASLPDHERIVLLTGRLLREAVLQQSALSANDAWCARRQAGRAARDGARRCTTAPSTSSAAACPAARSRSSTSRTPRGRATRRRRTTRAGVDAIRDALLARLEALA